MPFKKQKKNFQNDEPELEKFLELIHKKEDLISVIEILEKIQNQLSKENKKFTEEELKNFLPPQHYSLYQKIFSLKPLEAYKKINSLLGKLRQLPIAKITLAFSPTPQLVEKISNWFREIFGEKIILDIFINPQILGGIIIEFRGKYLDFSLEKEIDKISFKNLI